MVLKFIKAAFSRKESSSAKPAQVDAIDIRGTVTIGPRDSTMPLSQLELLRDAHLKYGDRLRAIVIGVPFHRIERTLAAAGFDTRQNLHTTGAARRFLNFEDAESGTRWTLAESELDRVPKPELRPGRRTPISESYLFADWTPHPESGRMRHTVTGREMERPTHLIFKGINTHVTAGSYDGIHAGLSPEALFERLRDFGGLGLNAQTFFRNVITVIGHTREHFSSELFCELITRTETLRTEIEYLVAHLDSLTPDEQRHANEAIRELMEIQDKIPPMAVRLALDLRKEIAQTRTPYSLDDFLTPGHVWHIATETHAEKQFAGWLKQDIQSRILAQHESQDMTLILLENWMDQISATTDRECLRRRDILQVYGIPRPDHFMQALGNAGLALVEAFHARLWHATSRDSDTDLLLKVYPDHDYTRQTLAYLHWERRLCDSDGSGNLIEQPVDINVDGMETFERARRASLRPHQY